MAEQAESVEKRIENYLFESEGGEPPEDYKEPVNESEPERESPVKAQEPEKAEEPEENAQPEGDDVEEVTVSSLNDLAEALGVDVADLYKVPIPINTPEGRKEVTLGEWKDSVQSAESLRAEQAKLSELVQHRQQEMQQFSQAMQANMQQANAVLQMAEAELVRDYQAVNWQELRQYDPAEFAAKQSEFAQRQGQISQAKQAAIHQWQQAQQQQMAMIQQSLPEQHKKLVELVPEWADESTASVEKPRVAEYLVKSGFGQEEIQNLYDARSVAIAYKAMKYDQLKSSKPEKRKVLKIGGKPIKPGKSQSKAEQREAVTRDQRMKFKKSGSVKDLASLLNTDEFLGDV